MSQSRPQWLDELISDLSQRSGATPGRTDPSGNADLVAVFSGGYPSRRGLPKNSVIDATVTALERTGEWALQYGPSPGDPGLIEALLAKLKRHQGIDAGPENLLITPGAARAVTLAAQMFIEPGDVVISESPTWAGAVQRFSVAGATVREAQIDVQGPDVDQIESFLKDLEAEGKRCKFIYVIPNFQNPTGVTMTLDRRQRLAELAEQYHTFIIEDDAYFDLRFEGDFLPTIYELDSASRVLYMGTYSKNMAAGMRLGWTVAHPEIISRMNALKLEGGANMFASQVAAEWTANGTLDRHLEELRPLYRSHRDAMLAALEREMPKGTTWSHPEGGFFIWVTLPEGTDASAVATKAADQGVAVANGSGFYFNDPDPRTLRLSYSFPSEAEIAVGIRILAECARVV